MTLRRSLILLAFSLAVLAASVLGFRTGHALTDASDPTFGSGATSMAGGQPAIRTGPSDWLTIPAPDVEFATVEGGTARLSDYRGQVVLLNFWGTWCPPCRVEIPHLIRTQESLARLGGTVIAPAVGSGSPEDILRFAAEYGISYPIWIARDAVAVGSAVLTSGPRRNRRWCGMSVCCWRKVQGGGPGADPEPSVNALPEGPRSKGSDPGADLYTAERTGRQPPPVLRACPARESPHDRSPARGRPVERCAGGAR